MNTIDGSLTNAASKPLQLAGRRTYGYRWLVMLTPNGNLQYAVLSWNARGKGKLHETERNQAYHEHNKKISMRSKVSWCVAKNYTNMLSLPHPTQGRIWNWHSANVRTWQHILLTLRHAMIAHVEARMQPQLSYRQGRWLNIHWCSRLRRLGVLWYGALCCNGCPKLLVIVL